ncbi:MAG: ATP-dependent Clp protease ATP-binding subunit ClpX [Rhodothermaceae bacterium]|nr:ATP-dependent Clp protease ATP-binding subunit ClpX [Rhodothermaceae bacterium]
MDNNGDGGRLKCSFCNRTSDEVNSLIAGQDVFICDRCITDARVILDDGSIPESESLPRRKKRRRKQMTPKQIKAALDEHVIGQERAKKTLAVAVYNHYKRVESKDFMPNFSEVELEKSNVLLLGPSGTGKTLLARTLARILDVPFSISDATTLTEAGYVGEDVETVISNLLGAADFEIEHAQRGIVFIDEIDKIARKSDNTSITRDVSGEGVQQALLKVIEGTQAAVPPKGGRKHPEQNLVQVDTGGILFICGGAFEGLPEIIARRLNVNRIGFTSVEKKRYDKSDSEVLQFVEPDDLMQFGLIPELIGRLPVTASLDILSEEEMISILTEPKNAIVRQYQKLFALDGIKLVFDESALRGIVARALDLRTGARGLRSILEQSMLDIMFEIHSLSDVGVCRITGDTILLGRSPIYEKRKASA